MKSLIVLVLGLLAVGCGQSDTERLEQENRRLKAQLESKKLKSDLEAESPKGQDDLLRLDVLGEYEWKDEDTYKYVFLDNGIYEWYRNGKKEEAERKWSIVKGDIHVKFDSGFIEVYRYNIDKSINLIADIDEDGKRTDYSNQQTFIKIK